MTRQYRIGIGGLFGGLFGLCLATCGPPPFYPFAEAVPVSSTEDFDIPSPSGQWRFATRDDLNWVRDVLKPLEGRLGSLQSGSGFCPVIYDRVGGGGWTTSLSSCFRVEAYQRNPTTPFNNAALARAVQGYGSRRGSLPVVVKQAMPFAGLEFLRLTHPKCLGGQALVRIEESRVLVVLFHDGCAGTGSKQWRAAERVRFKPAPLIPRPSPGR